MYYCYKVGDVVFEQLDFAQTLLHLRSERFDELTAVYGALGAAPVMQFPLFIHNYYYVYV